MLTIRKANERGHADHGWLNTHHTFSFADYRDPKHMGFRTLRVLNDDVIAGGAGFPFHGHENMEIISYVTEGALEHKDSMGNSSVIRPGDVQLMSAGSGVQHAEFNHLPDAPTHLYQIWIRPSERGNEPSYQERHFDNAELADQLRLIVSQDGRDGSLTIRQDASIYAGRLAANTSISIPLAVGRHAWIQVLSGKINVNGSALETGDGGALSDEVSVAVETQEDAELIIFDLN